MSESDGSVKVTDKRIFTPDGELREGYRHLDKPATETADDESRPASAEKEVPAQPSPEPKPESSRGTSWQPAPPDTVLDPAAPGRGSEPSFFDLVGVLAEPIALFLGDAKLPDGASAENLELARFHIDLLEVIQAKTAGNLNAEESALMEDLLYRLRLRYVQKTS
ncbi:MAG: DUF1844 domain-containing protein [Acidobacteriota bacterium]|nr:DUF1844 domain-containing protein [Acidobacteriota bacterium]